MIVGLFLLLLKAGLHLDKIWLLLMPLCGLLYGPELVVRVSINALIVLTAGSVVRSVEKWLDLDMSFVSSLVTIPLCGLLLALPLDYAPDALVHAWGGVGRHVETVAPLAEGVELTVLIMGASQYLVDGIEESPALCKGLILSVSGVSYIIVVCLLSTLWTASLTTGQFSLVMMTLLILLAIHAGMWNYDGGTVSDVAVLSAYVLFLIYCMVDDSQTTTPVNDASTLHVPSGSSFVELTIDAFTHLTMTFGQLTSAVSGLLRTRHVLELILRLTACVLLVFHLTHAFTESEEEKDTGTEKDSIVLSAPPAHLLRHLVIRILFLLLFTSVVLRHSVGDASSLGTPSGLGWLQIDGVGLTTMAQIFIVLGVYVKRVVGEDDDDDDED